jgi:hypothetical protein
MGNAPRPRTFDEVVIRLERLEANVDLVREGVQVTNEHLGSLAKELSRLRTPAVRERESSWNDLDSELDEFRRTLRDRVKDSTRFDSEHARAMVQSAIKNVERDGQAQNWKNLTKGVKAIIIGSGITFLAGVLAALWRAFIDRR